MHIIKTQGHSSPLGPFSEVECGSRSAPNCLVLACGAGKKQGFFLDRVDGFNGDWLGRHLGHQRRDDQF
jgi:hypothetical protein